jgi:polyisoprenoid-binding protein YceI
MPLRNRFGAALLALVVVVIAVWFLRPASARPEPRPTASATVTPAAASAGQVAPTPSPVAPTTVTTVTTATTVGPTTGDPAPRLFTIVPAESEARFIVDEVLFGRPNTVVGATDEVSGTISVDLADPTRTTVGVIEVNARSLATDNRFRNRSVNRLILQSNRDEYQYITLTPTAIEGLPTTAAAGDTMSLQLTGDLRIRDIVQPTTFAVTVTAVSEVRLEGLAVGTVRRADFDLQIPSVEGVADVSEEVRLELAFVAVAEE